MPTEPPKPVSDVEDCKHLAQTLWRHTGGSSRRGIKSINRSTADDNEVGL